MKIEIELTTLTPILKYLKKEKRIVIFQIIYKRLSQMIAKNGARTYLSIDKEELQEFYSLINYYSKEDLYTSISFDSALNKIKETLKEGEKPDKDFDFFKYLNKFLDKQELRPTEYIEDELKKKIFDTVNIYIDKQLYKDEKLNTTTFAFQEEDDTLTLKVKLFR